jgi:hypothetical protein
MSDVTVDDEVLSVDAEGRLVYSKVIAFLDRDGDQQGYFYTLTTHSGRSVTLTAKHLIYVMEHVINNVTISKKEGAAITTSGVENGIRMVEFSRLKTLFAEDVREGDVIMLMDNEEEEEEYTYVHHNHQHHQHYHSHSDRGREGPKRLRGERVVKVEAGVRRAGVYAPLTTTGTVVVDGALASCYAVINNPGLAHAVFLPLRAWHSLVGGSRSYAQTWLGLPSADNLPSPPSSTGETVSQRGVHPYAQFLYDLGSLLLSRSVLYVP